MKSARDRPPQIVSRRRSRHTTQYLVCNVSSFSNMHAVGDRAVAKLRRREVPLAGRQAFQVAGDTH